MLRPRLLERLDAGLHRKLTLIAAPAGSGKTTLLTAWLAGSQRQVAWLSLDAADGEPARFLTYLVAALRTVAAPVGEDLLPALQAPQPPPSEAILTTLLNEIAAVPHRLVLVLDDYHLIDAHAIDEATTFLLEHLPPQLHLVIASREDPPLPLARLRARNQLTEVRAADLRFTPAEAAAFLQAMNLQLSADEVAALEERTEGWIAGLQLAALSLQGRRDVPASIRAFAGDHRYILDYLGEEVLAHQPAAVRRFLLHTAILERLTGALCEAVTGQEGGSARLEALERGNFFVVPLDERRQWYRYHHLFAEVLLAHLRAEQPDLLPTLHRRASAWYEQHGLAAEAIRHALAAQDFQRATDLVERALPAMLKTRQEATFLGWLKALPNELVRVRPVLSVGYASALLAVGELAGVEDRLRDAERWLDTLADISESPHPAGSRPGAAMVVMDEEALRRLPGVIAVYRAGQAMALGDVPATVQYARRALDLVPQDDDLSRGSATTLLGLAAWTSGDLDAAGRAFAAGVAHLQRAENISAAIGLADILITQGRLHDAMRTYEHALQPAAEPGALWAPDGTRPVLRGTPDMYVGMSTLLCEQNNLDAATQHLRRSKEFGEHSGLPQNPYRWRVAMARILDARGDLNGAFALLQEAERLYVRDFFPNARPVAALKARVWVAQGRLAEALGWARAQGLSASDDLSYLREFEHITLARLLLAHHASDGDKGAIREAMALLGRLGQAAEAGGRTGSLIEILVLQALAQQMQDDIPAALVPLERALGLAEPEGYVRIFVDEGAPMTALLEAAANQRIAPRYTRRLLAAGGQAEDRTPVKQDLIEPLSGRELEVLRLLRTEMTGPEIARELMVSLHTVRTHTNKIYVKLGVNNRRAAVRRAGDLGLL